MGRMKEWISFKPLDEDIIANYGRDKTAVIAERNGCTAKDVSERAKAFPYKAIRYFRDNGKIVRDDWAAAYKRYVSFDAAHYASTFDFCTDDEKKVLTRVLASVWRKFWPWETRML